MAPGSVGWPGGSSAGFSGAHSRSCSRLVAWLWSAQLGQLGRLSSTRTSTRMYQSYVCIVIASIPLATASHMVKSSISVEGDHTRAWHGYQKEKFLQGHYYNNLPQISFMPLKKLSSCPHQMYHFPQPTFPGISQGNIEKRITQ